MKNKREIKHNADNLAQFVCYFHFHFHFQPLVRQRGGKTIAINKVKKRQKYFQVVCSTNRLSYLVGQFLQKSTIHTHIHLRMNNWNGVRLRCNCISISVLILNVTLLVDCSTFQWRAEIIPVTSKQTFRIRIRTL